MLKSNLHIKTIQIFYKVNSDIDIFSLQSSKAVVPMQCYGLGFIGQSSIPFPLSIC